MSEASLPPFIQNTSRLCSASTAGRDETRLWNVKSAAHSISWCQMFTHRHTHTHPFGQLYWRAAWGTRILPALSLFDPECGAANQRQPPIELHSILMMPDWQFESDAVWSVTVQGGCGLIEKCCSHLAGNSISARHFYFCLSLKQPQFIQPADPSTHTETGYTPNYLYG